MSFLTTFATWWSERSAPKLPVEDQRTEEPDTSAAVTIDAQGWIHGPNVIRMPSKRGDSSPLLAAGTPKCVVRHGTATARGTGGAIARSWRATYDTHSAHATLDVIVAKARDAEVKEWRKQGWNAEADQLAALLPDEAVLYQHRSLLTTSWHAGGSIGTGKDKVITSATIGGVGFNKCAIGIEMTCVGEVAQKLDVKWRGWREGPGVGYGPAVPDDQVLQLNGRYWHLYPGPAIELERLLDAALLERFPSLAGDVEITPSTYSVRMLRARPFWRLAMAVGHVDVDPKRKSDPYPTGADRGRRVGVISDVRDLA